MIKKLFATIFIITILGCSNFFIREIKFHKEKKIYKIIPNTEDEKKFLFADYGSKISDPGDARYADGGSSFVYRFRLVPGTEASAKIDIDNQYLISTSHNNISYKNIIKSGHKGTSGGNRKIEFLDLTDFVSEEGVVYIKIEDEIKGNGWGGRLYSLEIDGTFDTSLVTLVETKKKRIKMAEPFNYFENNIGPFNLLYVIKREPLNPSQRVLVASIQGLIAKKEKRIYMDQENYHRWLEEIKRKGIKTVKVTEVRELLKIFKSEIKGYILSSVNDYNIATSVAPFYQAVIADIKTEKFLKELGIEKLLDVRNKDYDWLLEEFKDKLSKKGLITISPERDALRDFSIANRLLYTYPKGNVGLAEMLYQFVYEGVPRYGWDAPIGDEREDVVFGSKYGLFTIPGDWLLNLSVLAGTGNLVSKPFIQKAHKKSKLKGIDEKKHYVTFIMSDGDNLNWMLDGCHRDKKFFANKNRGSFPIGWMIPPLSAELAPIALEWYYKNATPNDLFLAGVSGAGYAMPSKFSSLKVFSKITKKYMDMTDTKILVVLDEEEFQTEEKNVLEKFINDNKNMEGIFYMDYVDYARWRGKIYFIDGVPVVSFKYKLWEGVMNAEQLIEKLNQSSTDIYSEESYSVVIVHVWSYGLDEIKQVISGLNNNVKVVNPGEFLSLIRKNLKY